MGRQLTFCASASDWCEILKFLRSKELLLHLQIRKEEDGKFLYFAYSVISDLDQIMQRRTVVFFTKNEWTQIYNKSGSFDVSNSEVIELQDSINIGLDSCGVMGFRLYALMDAVADNAFVKKSEDFRNTYDQLTAFIKKYGMIDVEKRSYILPDAYRIYREHPDEVKGAYTCFSPKKIKTWPK